MRLSSDPALVHLLSDDNGIATFVISRGKDVPFGPCLPHCLSAGS